MKLRVLALVPVALGVIFVSACSSPDSNNNGGSQPTSSGSTDNSVKADPATSGHGKAGSRLQPRWRVADDGAQELVGWHDAELNVNCAFTTFDTGNERCVPAFEAATEVQADGYNYYTDHTCTEMLVTRGCDVPGVTKSGYTMKVTTETPKPPSGGSSGTTPPSTTTCTTATTTREIATFEAWDPGNVVYRRTPGSTTAPCQISKQSNVSFPLFRRIPVDQNKFVAAHVK